MQRAGLLFLLVLLGSLRAAADTREKLYLLPPKASDGVAPNVVSTVETLVQDGLHDSGRFEVLGRQDIAAIIGIERDKELAGCSDTDCAVQIAGALDVRLVSAISIDKLGETTLLAIRVLDTQKTRVLARASRTLQAGQDVVQACRLLVGALVTEFDASRAAPTTVSAKAPEAAPEPTKVLIEALDPQLDPEGPLVRTAGPAAYAAYSSAMELERQGTLLPEKAQEAWTKVAEIGAQNPFQPLASARALAWQAFVRRRSEDQRLAMAAVRNPSVDLDFKRFVLDQIGRTYGEEAFLPVLDETVPASLKSELCAPRVRQKNGSVLVALRALDDGGRPVHAEVEVDGVSLGRSGISYRVPSCATTVRMTERARGLVWTGRMNLAGRHEFEVVSRFPGERFQPTGDVVVDRERRLTWLRLLSPLAQSREWARTYCAELSDFGGGWRLPDADELESLHVPGSAVEPDVVTFPSSPEGWYWTRSEEKPAVLFDPEGAAGMSPRFGGPPSADGKGFVRCVRKNPRFAVRAGLGTLTGILGVGVEAKVFGHWGVAAGTGTQLLTAGITYNRAESSGGLYVDLHFALVRTGLLGREVAPGEGFGASVGYDFRPVPFLSVKSGLALAYSTANLRSTLPFMLELNAGPVF